MKCNLLLLFLLISSVGILHAGQHKAEKKISREFSIQPNGRLMIDNRYGDIDIAIGPAGKIKMDILITVESGSENKAKETLDRIQVAFSESITRVEAKTEIDSPSGWSTWFNTGNAKMEINYHVLVPADVYLELMNKYGDVYIESTNRDAIVELKYGDIRLGDLNANLELNMAYSDGSISAIKDGRLTLAYSDLSMTTATRLDLEMKYTDISVDKVDRLNLKSAYGELNAQSINTVSYSGKYDDISIEQVKAITAESGYSDIEIDVLEQSADLDMKYGDLQIEEARSGFTKININTSYTGVELGLAPGASATIDAVTSYCDVHHSGLKVQEDHKQSSTRTLRATKGSGTGQVTLRMNYGELSIH